MLNSIQRLSPSFLHPSWLYISWVISYFYKTLFFNQMSMFYSILQLQLSSILWAQARKILFVVNYVSIVLFLKHINLLKLLKLYPLRWIIFIWAPKCLWKVEAPYESTFLHSINLPSPFPNFVYPLLVFSLNHHFLHFL